MSAFLEAADRLGSAICRDAIWDGTRCGWLGDRVRQRRGTRPLATCMLGGDLYGGTAGIGVFLARLYRATGDRHVARTARGAMAHAFGTMPRLWDQGAHGFYTGVMGIACAALQCGVELRDEALTAAGLTWINQLARSLALPSGYDILSGCAGTLTAALAVHAWLPDDNLLHWAAALGERLVTGARRTPHGWAWDAPNAPGCRPLTGFSHGAGGIAWALAEFHAATGEVAPLQACREALRYEAGLFDSTRKNWPDLRFDSANPVYMTAWCHGAPGICLSRLRVHALVAEPQLTGEIAAALDTTTARVSDDAGGDLSLCHGAGGCADVLLEAAAALGRPRLLTRAVELGQRAIQRHESGREWRCGIQHGGLSPCLMLGWSGIGYLYLRLHDPQAFPTVLMPTQLIIGFEKPLAP